MAAVSDMIEADKMGLIVQSEVLYPGSCAHDGGCGALTAGSLSSSAFFILSHSARLCDIITMLPALVMMWKWRRGKPVVGTSLWRCSRCAVAIVTVWRDTREQLSVSRKLQNGSLNWDKQISEIRLPNVCILVLF